MVLKVIKPVEGAERCAAIGKYASDRQGRERGREQPFSDSYKPRPDEKELDGFDKIFASTARKPVQERSEFESLLLLRKMWEDSKQMQESAKVLDGPSIETESSIESAYIWGFSNSFRPFIKK